MIVNNVIAIDNYGIVIAIASNGIVTVIVNSDSRTMVRENLLRAYPIKLLLKYTFFLTTSTFLTFREIEAEFF